MSSPGRLSSPPTPLVSTVPPPSRAIPTAAQVRGPGQRDFDETRVVPSESGPFDDPHEAATRAYPLDVDDGPAARAAPRRGGADESDDDIVTQELSPQAAQELFGDPVTQQIDASELEPAYYESEPVAAAPIQDDGLLELSATTSSGEHEPPEPMPVAPMPINPAASRPSARPARWSEPPAPRARGFEEDAVTNVLRSDAPIPLPMPARRNAPPTAEVAWPEQPQRWNAVVWGTALVVVAVVVGLVVRTFLAEPSTGMATVITKPLTARVSIDGRPLVDQTSPFSVQGLASEVEHELVVEAEGYVTQRTTFRVEAGEVKLLPSIELGSTKVETGFELASMPSGARVVVDGETIEERTPVRLAKLSPGRHQIRLEREGHAPWETHLFLADGQMVELPQVTLRKLPEAKAPAAAAVASAPKDKKDKKDTVASRSAPARERTRASASSRRQRGSRRAAAASPAPASAAPAALAAPAEAGGSGTLRVNSRPWSQVFIDGRLIGNTPQLNIALPAGQHRVDLVNPQLGMKKSFSVRVRAGSTTTKIVNLVE